ncbi:hypothetical protein ACTXGQ_04145 [Marinobacter sp. 1Y8]
MIAFTDTDTPQFQAFPLPSEDWTPHRPYIEINDPIIRAHVAAGKRFQFTAGKDSVEIVPLHEIVAEALTQERAGMVVSRFQARAALLQAELLAPAETAIEQAGELAQLVWADAQEFRRNSPTVAAIASELGLTDEQIDDLFRQAATIEA